MTDNHSSSNIKKGTIITYITQFLNIAISLFYVPIMLGVLGQDEYGLYALVQSIISYFLISDMGIGITATRYNAKYIAENDIDGQRKINAMFLELYVGIAVICSIIGLVVYQYIPQIYHDYSLESIELIRELFVIAMVNLVLTLVFKIFNAIINAYEKFVFAKTLILIQTVIGPICMLAVLYAGYRSVGMLVVTTVITAVLGLIQMFYCIKKLSVKFKFGGFNKPLFITIMSFTTFVFLNSIAHQLFANSDKIVVSILLSEASIAVYAIVIQFQIYFYNFANVLSGFFLPRFTKMVKGLREVSPELMTDIVRIGRIQIIIAGLILGVFVAMGNPFIIRWVGTDYHMVYYLTIFIFVAEYITSCQSMFNSLMQAMNLHKIRSIIGLISAIFKIVLTIIFVRFWGLWGCAIAYFIASMIRFIAYNIYYKRVGIDVNFFWKNVSKPLCSISAIIIVLSFAFGVIQYYFAVNTYILILALMALYAVLYCVLTWMFCLNDYERELFGNLLKRFLKLIPYGRR